MDAKVFGSPSTLPNKWPAQVALNRTGHIISPLPSRKQASVLPAEKVRSVSAQLPSPSTNSNG
jgi:hypothetical protein